MKKPPKKKTPMKSIPRQKYGETDLLIQHYLEIHNL